MQEFSLGKTVHFKYGEGEMFSLPLFCCLKERKTFYRIIFVTENGIYPLIDFKGEM